ncbi:hypothetical protein [Halolamina salifodinae]|uniref:Uncharacterized protein n=1 Tax=Halolamina salifodinae TaxID=1202767 RepID=A0A8T4GSB2_9EURY|nr:hypothetical protein [Halolamina salifodinae]MBP1985927.1 hypothetical protein [Halolamina salifodinae]
MTSWNPGPKYEKLVRLCDDVLTDEKRTVRDIYYALEARGHEYEYRSVKRAVKKGRRAGYIDPSLIIDESRRAEATVDSGYDDAQQFVDEQIRDSWKAYRENFWEEQEAYVEVWLEKQSLASVFRPICNDLNVRLEATRGDWSDSKVFEASQRLASKIRDGNDVRVLYYGDFNPSGYHAPVSVQETMRHYGVKLSFRDPENATDETYFDIWPLSSAAKFDGSGGTLAFERRGINLEHIKRFDLPENPNPSSTDKDRQLRDRFRTQVSEGRDINVELNALKEYEREFLEDLIREGIEQHIDEDQRRDVEERIDERRDLVRRAVDIDDSVLGGGEL